MKLKRLLSPAVVLPALAITCVLLIPLVLVSDDMGSGDKKIESTNRVQWEEVSSWRRGRTVYRTEVPGGWLVMVNSHRGDAITFITDLDHEWLK